MNTTGRPPCFKVTETAMSDASHSTVNDKDSSTDCRVVLANSVFNNSKDFKALSVTGKLLHSTRGHTLSAKELIHFA